MVFILLFLAAAQPVGPPADELDGFPGTEVCAVQEARCKGHVRWLWGQEHLHGYSGSTGGDRLAKFVAGDRLKPFITNHLVTVDLVGPFDYHRRWTPPRYPEPARPMPPAPPPNNPMEE